MSAITGETTLLKAVRSRAIVLHDDSFVVGDLTDEVPDNRIIEFATGGPKNYAYKIARPDNDGNTTICKVRGITLNYKNSLTINFDTIKDMVVNNRYDVKTVRDDYKITRDHNRLLTVHQDKDYSGTSCLSSGFFASIAGMMCFHMSAITGETTLLKAVRSRAIVLHDDSFVEDYPVVFVLMYGK
jgi:hypothetical protein